MLDKKYYLGIAIDRVKASVMLFASTVFDVDKAYFINVLEENPEEIFKLNIGTNRKITTAQANELLNFMKSNASTEEIKDFTNRLLNVFYEYDASLLEINPIGIDKEGKIIALSLRGEELIKKLSEVLK